MTALQATPSTEAGTDAREVLLRLEDVAKDYSGQRKGLLGRSEAVRAVDGVSLDVIKGETLGLVGETGCGKSTLARCIARLTDINSGRIKFEGRDITRVSGRGLRAMRSDIQMIFQDPYGSLNPRRRVGSIIGDPFAIHHIASGRARLVKVQELMELVGLNPEHYNRFPAEFSGGQRQRIGVARALALRPKLIICDEPVSALDVSIQAQILNLLHDLQRELDLTYLFISHDLSVVRHVSSRIAVMYQGRVVELAPTEPLYTQPRHPYAHALRSAIPLPDPDAADQREVLVLPDVATSAAPPAHGCVFSPRCSRARDECLHETPALVPRLADPPSHVAACIFPMETEAIAQPQIATTVRRSRTRHETPDAATYDAAELQPVDSPSGDSPPEATVDAETGAPASVLAAARIRARGPWRLAFERLRRDRAAMISGVVIVLVVLLAICAPLIAAATGHGNLQQFPTTGRTVDGLPVGPNSTFLLGTDDLGRDLLVRIAYGARISLLVGVLATVLTVIIGVIIGLAAGYLGSVVDSILARLIDVMLSIPFLLFAISLASVYHTGLAIVIIVLAVFSWSAVARVVRGQVLSIREREYVEAARSLGAGSVRIMFTDILPNVMAPIIVYTTLLIPISIVGAATLSFLGVGVQPPTADWGAMLASASQIYQHAWWYLVFPGVALFITTVAFNVFGDGVRDAIDPRSHEIARGGEMIRFLIRRILLGVLVMLLVTMAVFAIFYVGPGGDSVARKLAGRAAPQSTVNLIKHRLGLDQSLWTQYWYFLWGHGSQHGLLQGNLGTDYYNGVSVNSEIRQELPISFWLIVGAALLWLLMGTISGVISAVRPRSVADRTFTLIALFFYSIPTFVLGLLLLLVFFYVLTVHGLAIFPASGYVSLTQDPWEWFRHLLLPWFTLAAVSAAVYTRLTRGAMLDVLGEDFIRTARSKGVSERRVIFFHALRPASSTIVSQFGIDFGSAVGAVIVIESIFGLPGLGYNVLNAVSTQDLPEIMGITIVGSAAVVLANLLADICYAVIDPRVRLQ